MLHQVEVHDQIESNHRKPVLPFIKNLIFKILREAFSLLWAVVATALAALYGIKNFLLEFENIKIVYDLLFSIIAIYLVVKYMTLLPNYTSVLFIIFRKKAMPILALSVVYAFFTSILI